MNKNLFLVLMSSFFLFKGLYSQRVFWGIPPSDTVIQSGDTFILKSFEWNYSSRFTEQGEKEVEELGMFLNRHTEYYSVINLYWGHIGSDSSAVRILEAQRRLVLDIFNEMGLDQERFKINVKGATDFLIDPSGVFYDIETEWGRFLLLKLNCRVEVVMIDNHP